MQRRLDAVQIELADGVVLPAHRIVQRVGAGVTPDAVEIMPAERRAGTGQLEQLVGGEDGDVGAQHLGLGDRDLGQRDRILAGLGDGDVELPAGLLEQSLRRMESDFQITDGGDRIRILMRMLPAAVDPGPGFRAHEVDGERDGAPGDACVDGGMDELALRPDGALPLIDDMRRQHPLGRNMDIVERDRAARRGALAEGRPVIDDGEALALAIGNGDHDVIILIERHDRHQMREERPRRVEFPAGHAVAGAALDDARLEGLDILAVELREGIAEPQARQDGDEQLALLRFAAGRADDVDDLEMVLRDLGDRSVGCRQDGEDLRHRRLRNLGAAIGFGHGDAPQAALREEVQLVDRQPALAIALARFLGEVHRKLGGDVDRLFIASDAMRRHSRAGRRGRRLPGEDRSCGGERFGVDEFHVRIPQNAG